MENAGYFSGTVYCPVCRFTDALGKEHIIKLAGSGHAHACRLGDKVPVLYLSGNPETAELDNFFQVWRRAILLGSFSLLAMFIGLGLLRVLAVINRVECQLPVSHIEKRLPFSSPVDSRLLA